MTALRCWRCGVEPEDTRDFYTFDGQYLRTVVTAWPCGDHGHAHTPPSPEDLADDGRRLLDRMMDRLVADSIADDAPTSGAKPTRRVPLKRRLWCSWRHRWQQRPYRGGWTRTTCRACVGWDRPIPGETR